MATGAGNDQFGKFDLQLFADEGGAGGAFDDLGDGVPAAGNEPGGAGAVDGAQSNAELEALKQQNVELQGRLQQLQDQLINPEYLRAVVAPQGQVQAPMQMPQAEPVPEPDWDNMTPQQLVKAVTDRVLAEVQPAFAKTDNVAANLEVMQLSQAHPDFLQYRDRMVLIAQRAGAAGRTISAEDAYYIAKGQAAEAAQRTAATTSASGRASTTPTARAPVAQSAPRPGGDRPAMAYGTADVVSLSPKAAANEAWRKVFGT